MRAWARLKQHWVRHLLAALQVAVGVAAVTAVLINVFPVMRMSGEEKASANLFSVMYGGRNSGGGSFWSVAFSLDDVRFLLEEIEEIEAASVYDNTFSALVRVDEDLFMVRGAGKVGPGFAEIVNMHLVSGRFFTPEDIEEGLPQVVVISEELAATLFPGKDPLGESINLRPESEAQRLLGWSSFGTFDSEGDPGLTLRVVGVFAYPEGTPEFTGFISGLSRDEMFIPATGRAAPSRVFSFGPGGEASSAAPMRVAPIDEHYSRILFKAADGKGEEAVAAAQVLLEPRIRARRGDDGDFGDGRTASVLIEPAGSGAAAFSQFQLQGSLLLGAMGVAALIVSGFSVFTTFLVSVAERIRAIGLARSLGATRIRILREVVGESVVLSLIGGLIGVLLALPVRQFALGAGASMLVSPPTAIDFLLAMVVGVALAVLIGALASLYPGWTVARLLPAEAFHEE